MVFLQLVNHGAQVYFENLHTKTVQTYQHLERQLSFQDLSHFYQLYYPKAKIKLSNFNKRKRGDKNFKNT